MEKKLPEFIYAVKTIAYDVQDIVDDIRKADPDKEEIGIEDVIDVIDMRLEDDDDHKGNMFTLVDGNGYEYD